jgi:hypothetical protein
MSHGLSENDQGRVIDISDLPGVSDSQMFRSEWLRQLFGTGWDVSMIQQDLLCRSKD